MADPVELARQLAAALNDDARSHAVRDAGKALRADSEAKALEEEYAAAAQKIQQLEQAKSPIEPDDKRKEADLRAKVAKNERIMAFLMAQTEFTALMNEVNQAIEQGLDLSGDE